MDDEDNKKNVPEECDGELECVSIIICCAFNRHGTLLAAGCYDGRVIIWDFLTRCEVRKIQAHVHKVTSISWSRDGNHLATSSIDNSLAVWDVFAKELVVRWFSRTPVMKVQFHPRQADFLLACPYRHPPMLINIKDETAPTSEDKEVEKKVVAYPRQIPVDEEDIESNITASFDRRGEYIFTGNVKGRIRIVQVPFKEEFFDSDISNESLFRVISSFKIQHLGGAPPAIRDIEFAPKDKRYFLVNSTDRAIRLYSCESALSAGINGNCEELRKFQEVVNKPLWRKCCFSGEKKVNYVCGGSARQHLIYIWDIETGAVKKMLSADSKGEALLDVRWHPSKSIVVSVANGLIAVWARAQVENWSAYAPTFKELDENQEYNERESEFDVEDEDMMMRPVAPKDEPGKEDAPIAVDKIEYENENYMSSDEEGYDPKALEFIPLPITEIPDDDKEAY